MTKESSRPAVPDVIKAFGQSAAKAPQSDDPELGNWLAMLQHQKEGLEDTVKAEAYAKYLARFDWYKDKSLWQKAFAVNHTVVNEIMYMLDRDQYHEADYWAAPIETALNRKGDCEDFALLQRDILRYLGVPDNKMFIALVNREGRENANPDHAVLLLDMAPDGLPPQYYVLNCIRPLVVADNAAIGQIWLAPSGKKADYVLVDARNKEGFWTTGVKYEAYGVSPPVAKNGIKGTTKPSSHQP